MSRKKELRAEIIQLAGEAQRSNGEKLRLICELIMQNSHELRELRSKDWWEPEFWRSASSAAFEDKGCGLHSG